jgi:hypothetical protein
MKTRQSRRLIPSPAMLGMDKHFFIVVNCVCAARCVPHKHYPVELGDLQ